MGRRVNKRELEEILGYSHVTLTEWQEAGMPIEERGDRGEANVYDTEAVIKWLIARESGRGRAESEKERLTRLQADEIELNMEAKRVQMAQTRGDLVNVVEFEATYSRLIVHARNFLRTQPVPLVQALALLDGEEAKVQRVQDLFDEFLTKLSRPALPDDADLMNDDESWYDQRADAGSVLTQGGQ